MKKHWLVLIVGAVGWAAVIVAESLGVSMSDKISRSVKLMLTTIVAVGLTIPFIEAAIEAGIRSVADAVSRFQPDIKEGFSRLVGTIQEFDLTSELRDLRKYLPHHVKYLQYSRTFFLEPEGHAVIIMEAIIKNISGRKLDRIILPIFAFGTTNYDESKAYDELLELNIDGKQVTTHIDAIRTKHLRSTPASLGAVARQLHMVECCYRVQVDLDQDRTVRIILRIRNIDFAAPMYEVDFIGARVYDITEKLVISIVAPENHTIQLMPTAQNQKGFTVLHTATEDEQRDEFIRISWPEVQEAKKIYWSIDSPLIGYSYAIRYQVKKPLSSD